MKDMKESERMTKEEFASAVTKNEKKLYIAALSVVRNTEDARDAVASAVAHAWEKLGSLKDENKFDGWLLRITYNEAKKMHRHADEYVNFDEIKDAFVYDEDHSSFNFFDMLSSAKLDNKSGQIIMLKFFYGYSLSEIADMTGTSLSTVTTRYYRAREKIKKTLRRQDDEK